MILASVEEIVDTLSCRICFYFIGCCCKADTLVSRSTACMVDFDALYLGAAMLSLMFNSIFFTLI